MALPSPGRTTTSAAPGSKTGKRRGGLGGWQRTLDMSHSLFWEELRPRVLVRALWLPPATGWQPRGSRGHTVRDAVESPGH